MSSFILTSQTITRCKYIQITFSFKHNMYSNLSNMKKVGVLDASKSLT